MKITFDTVNDSKDDLREVLELLKKILGEESSVSQSSSETNLFSSVDSVTADSSNDSSQSDSSENTVNAQQSSAPSSGATAAMMGMFNSEVPSNIPLNQLNQNQQPPHDNINQSDNVNNKSDESDDDNSIGIEIVPY